MNWTINESAIQLNGSDGIRKYCNVIMDGFVSKS